MFTSKGGSHTILSSADYLIKVVRRTMLGVTPLLANNLRKNRRDSKMDSNVCLSLRYNLCSPKLATAFLSFFCRSEAVLYCFSIAFFVCLLLYHKACGHVTSTQSLQGEACVSLCGWCRAVAELRKQRSRPDTTRKDSLKRSPEASV